MALNPALALVAALAFNQSSLIEESKAAAPAPEQIALSLCHKWASRTSNYAEYDALKGIKVEGCKMAYTLYSFTQESSKKRKKPVKEANKSNASALLSKGEHYLDMIDMILSGLAIR